MADAQVPELDTDVGTGTEGDVEARCFSMSSIFWLAHCANERTRFPQGSAGGDFLLLDHCWSAPLCSSEVEVRPPLSRAHVANDRLRKAIDARGRPQDMREWSQVSIEPPRKLTVGTPAHTTALGNIIVLSRIAAEWSRDVFRCRRDWSRDWYQGLRAWWDWCASVLIMSIYARICILYNESSP